MLTMMPSGSGRCGGNGTPAVMFRGRRSDLVVRKGRIFYNTAVEVGIRIAGPLSLPFSYLAGNVPHGRVIPRMWDRCRLSFTGGSAIPARPPGWTGAGVAPH